MEFNIIRHICVIKSEPEKLIMKFRTKKKLFKKVFSRQENVIKLIKILIKM